MRGKKLSSSKSDVDRRLLISIKNLVEERTIGIFLIHLPGPFGGLCAGWECASRHKRRECCHCQPSWPCSAALGKASNIAQLALGLTARQERGVDCELTFTRGIISFPTNLLFLRFATSSREAFDYCGNSFTYVASQSHAC